MKKNEGSGNGSSDRDTMRAEYDFSGAIRGVTAARFAQGANVIVIAGHTPRPRMGTDAIHSSRPLALTRRDERGGSRLTPISAAVILVRLWGPTPSTPTAAER